MTTAIVDTTHSPGARLRPVGVGDVRITDAFWTPLRDTNASQTLLSQLDHCESTHRLRNFDRAAGKTDAPFEGLFFNDSDVYKWLEGAAWTLASEPNADLDATVDDVIARIAAAQQPDGYLNSYFMFERESERFTNLRDMHEIYCAGHLFQAAVAHFRATGKRNLLDVARRLADCFDARFGDGDGKVPGACGHPEAEMALVELYRATGETRYFDLALHMVHARGRTPAVCGGGAYWQDHADIYDQTEVTGHAVRQLYLACGLADLVLEGEDPLRDPLFALWESFVTRRRYVTGGAGSRWEGEAFGGDWELTSERAYTETCAAIAAVMWAHRMFLLTGEARFVDAMEWTLFNAVLPGLGADGKTYFYQNPLADRGKHRRKEWFGCACCPPNLLRLLAQLPGYGFAHDDDGGVYVGLYAAGAARVGGAAVTVDASLPRGGRIVVHAEGDAKTLRLRVPDWANGATVNGADAAPGWFDVPFIAGAASAVIELPMEPLRIFAAPRALALRGQVAVARGPLVYCVEQCDVDGADIWDLALPADATIAGGDESLRSEAVVLGGEALYGSEPPTADRRVPITLIPYYRWANRAPGPMTVWLLHRP